uniref:Prolamin-like domain-containing protein n=1 Tax=Brassica campestris TaxID=3711 RepID=M4FC95_BRACM
METKTIFMAFFIMTTLVSSAYPSSGQEDVDVEPLVNPGHEFDTLDVISPASDVISPASQDYNIYMLEIIPPKYKMYVETCMDKMEPIGKCGLYVIKEILTNEHVSRECCLKVVRAGKQCFIETNKLMFQFYQLKRFASQVFFKINEVWNRCSAKVESPSSSDDFTI